MGFYDYQDDADLIGWQEWANREHARAGSDRWRNSSDVNTNDVSSPLAVEARMGYHSLYSARAFKSQFNALTLDAPQMMTIRNYLDSDIPKKPEV